MRGTSGVRRRVAVALSLALMSAVGPSALAANLNGYLEEKGHGDVALSYTSESYDHFWIADQSTAVPNGGDVKTTSTSIWLAYGISDRLTLIGNLPYIEANSHDGFGITEKAWQDLTLLGAYSLWSGGSTVGSSIVGAAGMRTVASNYVINNQPVNIGDGTADWLLRLVYQLRYRNLYVSQQVGYDIRGGDAPNNVPLHTEIGWTIGRITLIGFYSRVIARGGTDIGDPGFTFPSNGDEYSRAGGKVYGRITDGIGAGIMFFTTLNGRNTGDAAGASIGVDFSF